VLHVQIDRLGHVVQEQELAEGAVRPALRAGAVVGDGDDQSVVELADFLQEGDQLADVVIDVFKIRRVDLHLVGV